MFFYYSGIQKQTIKFPFSFLLLLVSKRTMDAKRPRRSQDYPSTDEAKYDRQLRLWGSAAQELLESAHVCVVGASALGAETLKNLVLPGVGRFTLIDIAAAEPAASMSDVASNFFVWAEDVAAGRARCDAVAARVLELNDRVMGAGRCVASVEQLLSSGAAYFRQFSLVVLTQCWDEALTVRLEGVLREAGVPLVVARCVGFWGWVRVSSPDHCVYDTHRTPPIRDLRIADPFPGLAAFASDPRFGAHPDDMSGLSPLDHSHVPFPVVLIKALRLWHKQQHHEQGTRSPTAGEIRSIVRTQLMVSADEENIAEALANATKALPFSVYGKALLENVCGRVFGDERADAPPPDSEFWLAVAALKAFHRATGRLPLPAERLPDMASYTSDYVELQVVYNAEAERDRAEVSRLAGEIREAAGCPPLPHPRGKSSLIDTLCKRAAYLYLAKYPTIEEEFRSLSSGLYRCSEGDTAAEFSRGIVVAMRIAAAFFAGKGRLPGEGPDRNDESDISGVRSINEEFGKRYGVSVDDGVLLELCRYGGAELHNIAAVVAGVVAQEAIKLVTHRFIPLENTFVYNGINSTGTRFNVLERN